MQGGIGLGIQVPIRYLKNRCNISSLIITNKYKRDVRIAYIFINPSLRLHLEERSLKVVKCSPCIACNLLEVLWTDRMDVRGKMEKNKFGYEIFMEI